MSEKCDASWFPMFFNMEGRKVLLVGAGNINLRRVNSLLMFGASITVVAPQAKEEILTYAKEGKITYVAEGFRDEMLTDAYFLVIASTDNHELNYHVTALAREKGILTNNAADKNDCDFFFPAIVKENEVVAGVCAQGQDHRLVRRVAAGMRTWLKEFLA